MAPFPEHDPKQAGHTKPAMEWNVDELIQWIQQTQNQQTQRPRLNHDVYPKLRKARVTGMVFLNYGDMPFFNDRCGLSAGDAGELEVLSQELKAEETSAGIKRKIQQAGSMDMSGPVSKKPHLESEPEIQLAGNAIRQRTLIRQKIDELNRQPVDPSSQDAAPPSQDILSLPKDLFPYPNSIAKFSDPTFHTLLPFPFVGGMVPDRFNMDHKKDWLYMGREKFKELVAKFKGVYETNSRNRLLVYGTRGYGKSHLLAALVCLLAAGETKVVYVPDCRALVEDTIDYMRAAMLFAWADDKSVQEVILTLKNREEMAKFLKSQPKVIYVIDQLNALEQDKDDSATTINIKSELDYWFKELVAKGKGILSTSANNRKILGGVNRQDYFEIMYAYGGLTKTEMTCWWERKRIMELADDKKFEVEDLTGCIPLLLDKCIVNGEIDLENSFFKGLSKDIATFELSILAQVNKENLKLHYLYLKSCIYGLPVQNQSTNISELVDVRYFYDIYDDELKDYKGYYSCGIARNAISGILLRKRLDYHDTEFQYSLPTFIRNPSVIGFMIEHAVLASIATNGLSILPKSSQLIQPSFFDGKTPSYDTKRNRPVLYLPKVFNFPHIDGIIVLIRDRGEKKPKLLMYPIQVTLRLDKHEDSREKFFSEWKRWTRDLGGFEVVPTFLWISPENASEKKHKADNKGRWPAHRERNIPISSVNREIWESYEEAKRDGRFQYQNPEVVGQAGGSGGAGGGTAITSGTTATFSPTDTTSTDNATLTSATSVPKFSLRSNINSLTRGLRNRIGNSQTSLASTGTHSGGGGGAKGSRGARGSGTVRGSKGTRGGGETSTEGTRKSARVLKKSRPSS